MIRLVQKPLKKWRVLFTTSPSTKEPRKYTEAETGGICLLSLVETLNKKYPAALHSTMCYIAEHDVEQILLTALSNASIAPGEKVATQTTLL